MSPALITKQNPSFRIQISQTLLLQRAKVPGYTFQPIKFRQRWKNDPYEHKHSRLDCKIRKLGFRVHFSPEYTLARFYNSFGIPKYACPTCSINQFAWDLYHPSSSPLNLSAWSPERLRLLYTVKNILILTNKGGSEQRHISISKDLKIAV